MTAACKISSKTLSRLFLFTRTTTPLSKTFCTATQTQKLEKIADEYVKLSRLEMYDFNILYSHKMGYNKYGPSVSGLRAGVASAGPAAEEKKVTDKVIFDVKLEKFDAASKIKIIKEVRSFTELGLKEAKDMVEKAPIVIKKGLTKEEAESISQKLKALGATVVLE